MERQHQGRRLTTILIADVAGYSRLVAADKSGTLAQLKVHRKELIEPKTAEYHGRVIKLMGDGALMEFGSVLDAVTFAVEVQRNVAQRNANIPVDRRIAYRIGINLCEIIVESDGIYGVGVGVAARLLTTVGPGGICVSGTAFDQADAKINVDFEFLWEHQFKGLPEPIRAFRVLI